MSIHKQKWLNNAEAACLLGVAQRTIIRWMCSEQKRKALGAVQNGKRYRIPRPHDLQLWASERRQLLAKLGVHLQPEWERDLDRIAKAETRYRFAQLRFLTAAHATILQSACITQEDKEAILVLADVVGEILNSLPKYKMRLEELESQVSHQLEKSGLGKHEAQRVMRYWPTTAGFTIVGNALTVRDLERIRRRIDYAQAIREVEKRGGKPTAANILALLHVDFMAHYNDTGETLPVELSGPSTPGELPRICAIDALTKAYRKADHVSLTTLDLRRQEGGISLRTLRTRYGRRQQTPRDLVAIIYDIQADIPGANAAGNVEASELSDS